MCLGHPLLADRFCVVAYRGGSGERPENTLVAVEHARRLDRSIVIEVDIQRTRDGVLVAFHDETLERTTDGVGRLDTTTFAALQRRDAGCHFRDASGEASFRGVRVPAIAQLLEEHPDARFVLDVHSRHPEAPADVVAMLERLDAVQRVVLASEHDEVIAELRRLRPAWLYAATSREVLRRLLLERIRLERLAQTRGRILMLPLRHRGLDVVTPRLLADAHARGERVWVWVIDDREHVLDLAARGVGGVFTTMPSRFVDLSLVVTNCCDGSISKSCEHENSRAASGKSSVVS